MTSSGSIAVELACGAFGGTVAMVSTYPADTVKTRMQAGLFPDFASCVKSTLRKEGFHGFYRGVTTPIMSAPIHVGSAFAGLELGKMLFDKHLSPQTDPPTDYWLSRLLVSGIVSGLCSATVVTPFERAKVIMQTTVEQQLSSPIAVLSTLIREQGVSAAFVGWGATIGREIPSCVVWFGVYEAITAPLLARGTDRQSSVAIGGVTAAISYCLISTPMDRVKTLQQMSGSQRSAVGAEGIAAIMRRVYAAQGVAGFFIGLNVALSRGLMIGILEFSAADQLRQALNVKGSVNLQCSDVLV
eukprot:gnl/MRDRNA2_/MRDRNA2_79867_c0_seq1.p1 gnl/MRDRNA2_/MRDRNA2_79867_c0~~gnl/MRDRNA2_/MRDRNA2_79867_c0_seq1.p1  ORF type:complete len:300 (-),score=29.96 gnl/MRDRNA2_/MRDRNA2_79867_c0_seq1:80-979(-)